MSINNENLPPELWRQIPLVQVRLKDPVCRIFLNKCPRSNKSTPPHKRTPQGQNLKQAPPPPFLLLE